VRKALIIAALLVWVAALASTLVLRGNKVANIVLLVVSLGLVALGLYLGRKPSQ
jgi:hypothetical protein